MEIDFEALGQRMLARKKELLANGIPSDAEHAMVEQSGGKADSPAAASANGKKVPVHRKRAAASTAKSRSAKG